MFRGFKRHKDSRHRVKSRNYNKEINQVTKSSTLKINRTKWDTIAYRQFINDEFGVKMQKDEAWRPNAFSDTPYYESPFDKQRVESYYSKRKHVGNIPTKRFVEVIPEMERAFTKYCPDDQKYHHDRTRWNKDKVRSKQRNRDILTKLECGHVEEPDISEPAIVD